MVRNPDGTVYASGRPVPERRRRDRTRLCSRRSRATTRSPGGTRWRAGTARPSARSTGCSGACMLMPRAAFDAVGGFDEAFPLYAEELDIATRLRGAGWSVLFTPEVEITARDRRVRPVAIAGRIGSWSCIRDSLYRYYAQHRAQGWRRVTLPLAWLALRAARRDRLARGEGGAPMKAVMLVGGFGHPSSPAHRNHQEGAAPAGRSADPRSRDGPSPPPRHRRGRDVVSLPRGGVPPLHRGEARRARRSRGSPSPSPWGPEARSSTR